MSGTFAIGLMSGTSADGIDAALVEIDGTAARPEVRLVEFTSLPYPPEVREQLFAAFGKKANPRAICLLDVLLGELFAEAAAGVAAAAGVPLGQVEFIASHGQTVWHEPAAV